MEAIAEPLAESEEKKVQPLTDDQRALVDKWSGLITFCLRKWPKLAASVDDPEGVAGEALCHAAKKWDQSRAKFSTFAVIVIRDFWFKSTTRGRRSVQAVTFGRTEDHDPLTSLAVQSSTDGLEPDEIQSIHRAVNGLPHAYAEVIRSHYLEGKPMIHVAQKLGVSRSRIGQIHQDAIVLLRRTISWSRTHGAAAHPIVSRTGLDAIAVRYLLAKYGPCKCRFLARQAGQNFVQISRSLAYGGWFAKLPDGRWDLTDAGRTAIIPKEEGV